MKFLYPIDKKFPFDSTCEQIVLELEKRNWQVPNIVVNFHEYGSRNQFFKFVSEIVNQNFKIIFYRVQCNIPNSHYKNIAGVSKITIPEKELWVFDDDSGPSLFVYNGNNYNIDRENFISVPKTTYLTHYKPMIYIGYDGVCECNDTKEAQFVADDFLLDSRKKNSNTLHTHINRLSPLLIRSKYHDRYINPSHITPERYNTETILLEFKQYLEDVVMKIKSHPIPQNEETK